MKIKFLFYIAFAKVFKDFKMICMETSDTLKKMYTKDKKVEINEHYTPRKKKKKKSNTIYTYVLFLYKMTNNIFVCK